MKKRVICICSKCYQEFDLEERCLEHEKICHDYQYTNWDYVRRYRFSDGETLLMKKLFEEFLAGNSCFEDCDDQTQHSMFDAFEQAWILSKAITESKNNDSTDYRMLSPEEVETDKNTYYQNMKKYLESLINEKE